MLLLLGLGSRSMSWAGDDVAVVDGVVQNGVGIE